MNEPATRAATSLLVASSFCLFAGRAHAQEPSTADVERARALFAEGVALVEAHAWADAEAHFREALTLRDAPSIRYNLASVLFEQGRYAEASALSDQVLADSTTPDSIREHTTVLRRHIDERAGYAAVRVTGGDGARIDVDGWTLSDPMAEVPLAAGAHAAHAQRDDLEIAAVSFELAVGEHRVVELDASPAEPEPALVEPIDVAEATPMPTPTPLVEEWWFWTAIGGGAVVIGVVVGVAVATSSGGGVEPPVVGNYTPGVLRW